MSSIDEAISFGSQHQEDGFLPRRHDNNTNSNSNSNSNSSSEDSLNYFQPIGQQQQQGEDDNRYLKVPKPNRLFLISPPASPPLGWEHSEEGAPVNAHPNLGNLQGILDAKTPREYYEAVYQQPGSAEHSTEYILGKVAAKLAALGGSKEVESTGEGEIVKKVPKTETVIRDIYLTANTTDESMDPRPAILIEFPKTETKVESENDPALPKVLIEDTSEPHSYSHSLDRLPITVADLLDNGGAPDGGGGLISATRAMIPQTRLPPRH